VSLISYENKSIGLGKRVVLLLLPYPTQFFTGDLQICLKQGTIEDVMIVDVESVSRVSKSDFGGNRRRVIQLLTALDEKFEKAKNK
jgi:hypothetical protein